MVNEATQSDDPSRAFDILGTPLVLRILYGLGHGLTPAEAVEADADPAQIDTAVRRLVEIGAAQYGIDGDASPRPDHAVLTAKGKRVVEVIEASAEEPPDPQATDRR